MADGISSPCMSTACLALSRTAKNKGHIMPDPFWTEINDQLSAVSKAEVASFTAVRDILLEPARTAVIDEINRNGQRRFGPLDCSARLKAADSRFIGPSHCR